MKTKVDGMNCAAITTTSKMLCLAVSVVFTTVATASGIANDATTSHDLARRLIGDSKVQGGLVVHIGCGEGSLTGALRANERFLVHGLETNDTLVQEARRAMRDANVYGNVSVDCLKDNRLPYVDNLVNLVIVDRTDVVSKKEVLRVLAPNGVAYFREGGTWTKTTKPWPKELDQWTHYLHDASGNAVAHDQVVGPPRHLQWIGSPRWSRHHDRMASMTALVSSGGRIFYIFDEGSTAAILLPDKRMLVARDAFNGTILWKRPLANWFTHLFPYKSGPAQLPRRLVAVHDRVFVTLALEAPLTALDAATGQTLRTYEETDSTEEVLFSDGVLFLLVNREPAMDKPYTPKLTCMHQERDRVAKAWTWNGHQRDIMALEADSGTVLWKKAYSVVPLTLAADGGGVFFHNGESVVRLDRRDGNEVWRSGEIDVKSPISSNFGPTLVVYKDVVLFAGGDRKMTALSAETGETLWSAKHPRSGHHSPEDLLVSGGLVWAGDIAAGKGSGVFTGRDLYTGEVKNQFPPDVETYWFHQRCYRSKATDRFLLPSRTGIEFVDTETQHWDINHWVRGGCIYGIMPCNGLVYAPPHSCACYIDAKLNGFNALASKRTARIKQASDEGRLKRGAAYDEPISQPSTLKPPTDWPTYRHDAARTGFTAVRLPASLKPSWKTAIGGRLSSVVVAGGRLYVAQIDAHTVHALDAKSGSTCWEYTAGARVDSPPTVYRGRVLFGCADGYVYCLREGDGELMWRFRAAPEDRRLMAYEQPESCWPVHGSVLVQDDVLYCVAGRSMFVDGGMRFLKLDPNTGRKLAEVCLDERDPESGKNLQTRLKVLNMPVALPDVLSSDGCNLYMRTQRFGLNGVRQQIEPTPVDDQDGKGAHLFSGAGYLDDTWFHRAYWIYGKSIASGANGWFQAAWSAPAGRVLVVGEEVVYGFGRKPEYYRWATPLEYHVFSVPKKPTAVNHVTGEPETPKYTEKCLVPNTKLIYNWSFDSPLLAQAMLLAGETLFVAGPPDLLDAEAAFERPHDPAVQRQLQEQAASHEGKRGGLLLAISAKDGKTLAKYHLDTPPRFDGMAASDSGLYMATTAGDVICFSDKSVHIISLHGRPSTGP